MRRIPLLGVLAAAAVLIPAAASQAATVSYESGAIVYRGEGSEGLDLLTSASDDGTLLYLSDDGASRQKVLSGPCTNDASWGVICDLDPNTPLKVYGSSAKDSLHIYFHGIPESMPIQIHGGGGDDEIQDSSGDARSSVLSGDAGKDTIKAYAGDDSVDGGDGNDEVDGGEGNDKVYGGAGNDTMWGDHYDDPGADL